MQSAVSASNIPCTSAAFAELSAEILGAGKALRFQARGTSMGPLVRDGDVVLVRPAEPGSVQVGDVVLCRAEADRIVLHRVVGRRDGPDGPRFAVQGDQVGKADGLIPASQVYGRATTIERAGARLDLEQPVVRWLGRLAALRSRRNFGRGRRWRPVRQWVKRLPGLSRYLA